VKGNTVAIDTAAFRKKLDRLGYLILKKKASDAEPWRQELKDLSEEIQKHYERNPADVPIRARGEMYFIDLTQREYKRTITDPQKAFDALKRAMGLTALVKAIKFTFKLLDQHIPAEKQAAFVLQERTGSRDIDAVLIEAPGEAA